MYKVAASCPLFVQVFLRNGKNLLYCIRDDTEFVDTNPLKKDEIYGVSARTSGEGESTFRDFVRTSFMWTAPYMKLYSISQMLPATSFETSKNIGN